MTVYAYLTEPLVAAFGPGWLHRGTASVKFVKPVLDGEAVQVAGEITARDPQGGVTATVRATTASSGECAVLTATVPAGSPTPLNVALYAEAPLPAERPPGTREYFDTHGGLGTFVIDYNAAQAEDYVTPVSDPLPLYRRASGWVHPAFYTHMGNRCLRSNVLIGRGSTSAASSATSAARASAPRSRRGRKSARSGTRRAAISSSSTSRSRQRQAGRPRPPFRDLPHAGPREEASHGSELLARGPRVSRDTRAWFEANTPADELKTLAERKAWHRTLYEAGYVGMLWPKEYGGRGATPMQQAIVQDEMARASAPPPINGLGIGFIGPTIIVHGTEAQKQRYLKKMLTAEEIWCQLYSEPNAGSDLAGPEDARRGRAAITSW